MTQSIATKFPEVDIKEMDNLVNSGEFISRSDLIRNGTRKIIQEANEKRSDLDTYVIFMHKSGTFKDPSLNVIAKMHIKLAVSPEKATDELSENELKLLNRLLRHPFKPVAETGGKYFLTKNGIIAAEGFLEGLFYFKKMVK